MKLKEGSCVKASSVRPLLDELEYQSIRPGDVFDKEWIEAVRQPGEFLPVDTWRSMFERAIVATDDPALPLKVGARIQPAQYGILGYAALSGSTVDDALAILQRYETLVDDVNETRLVLEGETIELHWLPLGQPPEPLFMQLSLSSWLVMLRHLTGVKDLPGHAHFAFPKPSDPKSYHDIFATVRFDSPVTRLVLAASVLELPVLQSDPETHRLLLGKAESELQASSAPKLLLQLRSHLLTQLPTGRTRLEDMAEKLGTSPRSLQHQLRQVGSSYRQLLDGIRLERSEHYLAHTGLSLCEIGFLLGYAEQSAFNHAFRRWKGQTPQSYRDNL